MSGRYAEEWFFLWLATGQVPPGATFTVRAADLHREMSLYMMSVGLLPRARSVPASYHGRRLPPELVPMAEYLLIFRCELPAPPDYEFHAASPSGCVFRRKARP